MGWEARWVYAKRFDAEVPRARLLWLPALGVPARKYEVFASGLAQAGLDVVVHEWRGTGDHPEVASRARDWGYAELLREDLLPAARSLSAQSPGLPLLLGGHSLGGQFAALTAAMGSLPVHGLVLMATGVPHWRLFPRPMAWQVAAFALALPWLTGLVGHYPGNVLGFAGREAAGLMRDWASTVRSGRYDSPRGLPEGIEAALAALDLPVLGLRPAGDRLVPQASLVALLDRCGRGRKRYVDIGAETLGVPDDHFRWMRSPGAIVHRILDWADEERLVSS